MKVLRSVFVVLFISTLFVVPAQARGSAGYGFVALVNQADPSMPLIMQAQHAYRRLLPGLLAAQKSGMILAYEPDLSAGILKIEYAADARTAMPAGLRGLDNIQAAVALVPHKMPAGVKPQTSTLLITPIFEMDLFSSCFSAAGLGTSSHILGKLSDKTGRVVANYVGDADTSGYLYSCFDYSGPYSYAVPGYKVVFNIYDPASAPLGAFSATIPQITFTAFNKNTSVVAGSAPKNKPYSIEWYHPNLDASETYTDVTLGGMVPANGLWSVDFGTTKLRGNDLVMILATQNPVFQFGRYFYIPSTYCIPGSNFCAISGFPQQAARLNITHAGVTRTFKGKFNNRGEFDVELVNASGAPISMKAGDKISGTGIAAYKLPSLTAIADFASDAVNGKAPTSKYFRVWVKDVSASNWYSRWANSNASHNYAVDFSSSLDLKPGMPLTLEVDYLDPVSGNESDQYFSIAP
jgi:hypothetical protein